RVKGFLEVFKRSLKESALTVLRSLEGIKGSFRGIVEVYLSFRELQMSEHELLKQTLDFLGGFAKERNLKLVVMFDEFQKVSDFDSYMFRLLKSRTDKVKDIRYIFSGSSLSVLQNVFLQPRSPMYLVATKVYLKPIEDTHVRDFILQRLKHFKTKIDDDALEELCNSVQGMPFYFQKLGDMCYRRALLSNKSTITKRDAIGAFQDMIAEFDTEFESRFEHSFSPRQKAILKANAKGDRIRISEIAKVLRLSVNKLGKDMKLLCDSLTIERIERGRYDIVDRVFKRWLAEQG
ncbi:MAG: ATP-binding protein, partial [Thermoplasmata archaeon]|nr:ATP-binding protein [Thermoplasmata archaeon]